MLDYDLTDRAVRDMRSAREWYDRANVKLGNEFIDDVLAAIRLARERPASFPVERRDVRTVRCQRFPYRVYFRLFGGRVVVAAVYHTSRNPSRWDDPDRE
jgi:plasmid stabilization system protein ParE